MSASDKNSITFHSPELSQAFDRYGEVLTGYNSARDKVSEDIKLLERKLQQANLKVDFHYSLGTTLVNAQEDSDLFNSIEIELRAEDFEVLGRERIIFWDKVSKDQFRLMFSDAVYVANVGFDAELFPKGDPLEKDVRPLIEATLSSRLFAHKFLPDFLRGFAEKIQIPGVNSIIQDDDSIPF